MSILPTLGSDEFEISLKKAFLFKVQVFPIRNALNFITHRLSLCLSLHQNHSSHSSRISSDENPNQTQTQKKVIVKKNEFERICEHTDRHHKNTSFNAILYYFSLLFYFSLLLTILYSFYGKLYITTHTERNEQKFI